MYGCMYICTYVYIKCVNNKRLHKITEKEKKYARHVEIEIIYKKNS